MHSTERFLPVVLLFTMGIMVTLCEGQGTNRRVGCPCPYIHQPVCGSDGKTYGNQCLFDCTNRYTYRGGLSFTYGACQAACVCPRIFLPVCGSDGKTYDNSCQFDCANRNTYSGRLRSTFGACEWN